MLACLHTYLHTPSLFSLCTLASILFCFIVWDEELIHPSILCSLMMKYKSQGSLAAAMVNELFDVETRLKSNVRGRGKDQLNPKEMEHVKKKCFDLFPSARESDTKQDWDDCIVSIDDKGRELKQKLKKQQVCYLISNQLDPIHCFIRQLWLTA